VGCELREKHYSLAGRRIKWAEKAAESRQQNRDWCSNQPHYHETVTTLYNSVQLTPQEMEFYYRVEKPARCPSV
jgi:hypothetical protein